MNLTLDLTLDDFRSMMLLLEAQHGGTQWTLPSGARLVVQRGPDSDPTIHAAWVVSIPIDVDGTNRRHATIQAFRQAEGTIVLVEDRRRITSSGQSQLLDPDRAIGPLFHELCHELQRHIDLWAPPTISDDGADRSPATLAGLDPLDRKIIEVVRKLEDDGYRATDALVAARLPLNPRTHKSYHRVTISKRRNKLRDQGHKV